MYTHKILLIDNSASMTRRVVTFDLNISMLRKLRLNTEVAFSLRNKGARYTIFFIDSTCKLDRTRKQLVAFLIVVD